MKRKINCLGLLSLLSLIALLAQPTNNEGLYGFLGFAYYLRYFFVQPDELFRLNLQKAATAAFFTHPASLPCAADVLLRIPIRRHRGGPYLLRPQLCPGHPVLYRRTPFPGAAGAKGGGG